MEKSNLKPSTSLIYILAFQTVVCISIVLDIPFIRQILGFLFFIFIPGFVLLRILKLKMSNEIETVLFSIGLSIAFLMLIGFLINELGTWNFISNPLSTKPLVIIVNIAITVMCVFSCFVNKEDVNIIKTKELRPGLILPHLILPFLGIIGVLLINTFNNNLLLIFAIILIPIVFVLSLFNSKLSSYYPLIIVSIALTLLLSNTIITRYPYGDDINFEFNVFTLTKETSYWNPRNYNDFDQFSMLSMLSVTVLPTMFLNLLNIEEGWMFKTVFPIIFSLVPLALYQLYQIHWGKRTAFISTIFFMVHYEFFQLLITNAKQMTSELFYVLLLIMLTENRSRSKGKVIVYMFLVFALVVSHYSMNYILLFAVLFIWLLEKIFPKNNNTKLETINVAFLFCFTFFWYTYIVYSPFYRLAGIIETTFTSFLREFFLWESRGELIQTALGVTQAPSIFHNIGIFLHNITSVFILIGFISLLVMWKRGKIRFEYCLFTSFNMGLIFSAIVIPRFAGFLQMARLYHVALLFASPLFVIGTETFVNALTLRKRRNRESEGKNLYSLVLISILLVTFFLFQSGFVYEISGDSVPSSISLSKYKMEYSYDLIHESDAFSAIWLSNYGDIEHVRTYTDTLSLTHVLASHSPIRRNMMILISNTTQQIRYSGIINDVMEGVKWNVAYIYLSRFNVMTGMAAYNLKTRLEYNITEIPLFSNTGLFNNKIYSNAASEVYYRTPLAS